jgi:hypothetical protein
VSGMFLLPVAPAVGAGAEADGAPRDAQSTAPVMLSTVPQTHTPDMHSWFPLFIPLSQPVRVCQGDTITAHIWR